MLRRGLARDREDRYPDVTAFVAALDAALGPIAAGPATQPWLDRDPELTQPGPRPTPQPGRRAARADAAAPARPRGSAVLALVGLLALAVGGGAGYAAQRGSAPTERTVDDDTGTLSVTVPADWDRADATEGWRPPNADGATFPALSVGTQPGLEPSRAGGEGVFVGAAAGHRLPEQVPQHPECDDAGRADPGHARTATTRRRSSTPTARRRRHRRARGPGDREHAAVGPGPQRRPRHRQPGPRRRRDPRDLSAGRQPVARAARIEAVVRASRSREPLLSTVRPVTAATAYAWRRRRSGPSAPSSPGGSRGRRRCLEGVVGLRGRPRSPRCRRWPRVLQRRDPGGLGHRDETGAGRSTMSTRSSRC